MKETVLITGGAGFLGAHLAKSLAQRQEHVIVYDSFFASPPKDLFGSSDKIKVVQGDILDLSFLIRTLMNERVNRIIHTAALVSFAPSIEKPALTAKINIEGTINVLEAARIVGVDRMMDIGSEEIYGDFQYEPADEEHPVSPTVPYAITKAATERYEQFYHRFFGLDAVIIRTSWVYGPGLPRARFPKTFIENGLKGIPTNMENGADYRVDQTYIDDFVQGALLAFEAKSPKHRVFNIASGKAYSVAETAKLVQEIIPGAEITIGPGFLKHAEGIDAPRKGALNIQRAKSDLGYEPQYDLFEGLKKYIEIVKKDLQK